MLIPGDSINQSDMELFNLSDIRNDEMLEGIIDAPVPEIPEVVEEEEEQIEDTDTLAKLRRLNALLKNQLAEEEAKQPGMDFSTTYKILF